MAALPELRHPRRQAAPLHLLTASAAAAQSQPDDSDQTVSLVSTQPEWQQTAPGSPSLGTAVCACRTTCILAGACLQPSSSKQGWHRISICSAISQQQRCLSFLRAYSCSSKLRREAADLRAQQQGEAARSIATAAREATATLQRLGKQQAAAAAERAEAKAKQDAIDEVRSDCIKLLWQPVQCPLPAVGTRGGG
jgi:hypothetical protein